MKTIAIEILKEAEVDILEGFNFYELQQTAKVNAIIDCRRNPAWIRRKLKK